MAHGYPRVAGRLAVCCGTAGPGATNLVSGVERPGELGEAVQTALDAGVPAVLDVPIDRPSCRR